MPDVPQPCHALVDLYGQCEQVTIVSPEPGAASGKSAGTQGDMEKADMVDGIKESVCWGPPPAASPLKSCEYHALCSRFQELLLLPEDYFMPPPKRSLCYCESCRKLRGDEAHRRRGEPPGICSALWLVQVQPQGESPPGSWDTNQEVAHGVSWEQCGSCTEGAGPGGAGSRYRLHPELPPLEGRSRGGV